MSTKKHTREELDRFRDERRDLINTAAAALNELSMVLERQAKSGVISEDRFYACNTVLFHVWRLQERL